MNEKQFQKWQKWHDKGYGKFMLFNMGGVCAFYAFTGTIAVVQMFMTMPPSVKSRGGTATLFITPIIVLAILIPAAFVFMHVTWKIKEKQYAAYLAANQPVEPEPVSEPAGPAETPAEPESEEGNE